MKFSKLPLALAVTAAMCTGLAYAGEGDGHGGRNGDTVDIDKEVDVDIDIEHKGYVQTLGLVLVDSTATAISDVSQKAVENTVNNGFDTRNNATATGDALNGATGNIGLNVAAGDNNLQQNSTAISRIVSPDSVGVSVEAGYDIADHKESAASYSRSHKDARAKNSDWSVAGSASHSDSNSLSVDITDGVYTHSQDEHSTSDTSIDANVTGGLSHKSGAKSYSSKGMETAGDSYSGGAGHDQSVGFKSGEYADLEVGQGTTTVTTVTPGEGEGDDPTASVVTTSSPSTYSSNDTTETNSSTDISANFSSSYTDSEENAWEISGDANHDSSYSSENESSKEKSYSSSYDYTEFARLDANLVFGAALDAETFSNQAAYSNQTNNAGVVNTARLNGNVGQNASGNVNVNITAGSTNAQANQLAIAAGTDAVSALATAASSQTAGGNSTDNAPDAVTDISVSRSRIVVRQRGEASGTYAGQSDQIGNVYLDTWAPGEDGGNEHENTTGTTGHIDVDNEAEGAQDLNQDGGAFAFNEAGELTLSGIVLTGSARTVTRTTRYLGHANNASISGNALRGASGNIGINVSAGSSNLQGNSLAIASVRQSNGGGTGGEPQ